MKKLLKGFSLLTVMLVVICSLCVTSFAAKKAPVAQLEPVDTTQIVNVADKSGSVDEAKFVLYVGKEFVGRHFTLETDAGMAPHAYTVNKDGYIEFYFETGSSSKFELALLDNKEPTVTNESLPVVEDEEDTTDKADKEDNKKTDKENKNDFGKKLAVLFVIFAFIGGTYLFMCKKSGVPVGFKKKGAGFFSKLGK